LQTAPESSSLFEIAKRFASGTQKYHATPLQLLWF